MTIKLYLCLLAGTLALAACQRRVSGGFLPSHPEILTRTVPIRHVEQLHLNTEPTTVRAEEPNAEKSEFTVALPTPEGASPVLLASSADQLVDAAKGTKYEARALRMKAAVAKAEVNGKLNAAPRKLNFAEKAVTKLVAKKLNKKIAEAQRGHATQRIDSNISLGIIFLAVALILALLSVGSVYVVIAGVLGAAFLLIGLLNQAAG